MLFFLLLAFHNRHLHPKRNKTGIDDEKIIKQMLVKCLIAQQKNHQLSSALHRRLSTLGA